MNEALQGEWDAALGAGRAASPLGAGSTSGEGRALAVALLVTHLRPQAEALGAEGAVLYQRVAEVPRAPGGRAAPPGLRPLRGRGDRPAPRRLPHPQERGLRPHLLVHDEVRSEFDQIDTSNPNCVVIGDAGEHFSYRNMNRAFQVLMGLPDPVLLSLGKGRYYKETSGLMLDVGGYMKALEYACGIEAEVVGKPSPEFFRSALRELGVEARQAVMIGDDIVGDVGGAQRCGMRALQVRTGKFR
ncbi:hypothetical protein QTO34_005754 [Cnephaeus nilssonii]|uniref:Phospholysine phosphohistidine inorganic pyrophosphate phosphatase n=1 Tax=Cnephaeus nilssonii TaxID=3371016 RepID=A0AA40HLE0_CNENI|nr:hypothetical protein QTO34_005754 [Eptesicus nilssonii]